MPEQYDRTVKVIPLVKERKGQGGTPYSDIVGKVIVYASGRAMVAVPALGAWWRIATEKTWTPQQGQQQPIPAIRQEAIVPPTSAPFGNGAPPNDEIPF